MKNSLLIVSAFLVLINFLNAGKFISDQELWKHVVTVDRLAWQEREGIKKVNKIVDDKNFVRRLYLDITGKIPTYDQLTTYLKSKDINKRTLLIDELLDSPGYVGNFSNFWLDLMRGPQTSAMDMFSDNSDHHHNEFTRYIERVLKENRPYDKIVYDLMTADGSVQENQAIGFYYRDHRTNPMDTLNAATRAFLGTRLGCAQCHNHRFDKWTQKEFYESAAHLWGVTGYREFYRPEEFVWENHQAAMVKDKRFKGKFSKYSRYIFHPSRARVTFDVNKNLTYPENYRYDDVKPSSEVKERIVFGYGDEEVEGKDRREVFAKWMTSKNNPMFARIMPNRLWKRIMGVTMLEPLDDWKDNLEINNEKLFNALGEVFVSVNYDFKALLSIIFNSEAYQLDIDLKNEFLEEDYKLQGSLLKRMSAAQLRDSLFALQYGDLDVYSRLDDQYFEFEDKVNKLAHEFKKEMIPMTKALIRSDDPANRRYCKIISDEMLDRMFDYLEKLRELEDYYDIDNEGYIKSDRAKMATLATGSEKYAKDSMMMMKSKEGDFSPKKININYEKSMVKRANYKPGELMDVFGASDHGSPDTNIKSKATMKQLLKLINSDESKSATSKDSYLMKEVMKKKKLGEKISFMYYSIYGRAPTKKDLTIASKYLDGSTKDEDWSNYALALINSPEFYFIK